MGLGEDARITKKNINNSKKRVIRVEERKERNEKERKEKSEIKKAVYLVPRSNN